jgi:hypothetical protein
MWNIVPIKLNFFSKVTDMNNRSAGVACPLFFQDVKAAPVPKTIKDPYHEE